MTHVNFTIESKLNGNNGELVVGTILKSESNIPKGDKREFSLKAGDELGIKVKQNGNIIALGNGFNIWVSPPEGVKILLTTTKEELKIKLESIDTEKIGEKAQIYSVTVGVVNTG